MITIQEKVFADITALMNSFGFDPVNVAKFSNMGYISVQVYGVVAEHGAVEYDFQGDHMTFKMSFLGEDVPSNPGKYHQYYVKFSDNEAYAKFRADLERELSILRTKIIK